MYVYMYTWHTYVHEDYTWNCNVIAVFETLAFRWVNRKDPNGRNIFTGGFLGLDNIGEASSMATIIVDVTIHAFLE